MAEIGHVLLELNICSVLQEVVYAAIALNLSRDSDSRVVLPTSQFPTTRPVDLLNNSNKR